ncbi:MAG: YraN family protein [Actinomycetota bacterium]
MCNSAREVQRLGEEAAARYLRRRGWTILARNWRVRVGELDLVVRKAATLVFVEVKTRTSSDFLEPQLGVDFSKQGRLRRVALAYLANEAPRFQDCRFDVISVVLNGGRPRITRHEAAF